MNFLAPRLRDCLARSKPAILVRLDAVKGSTPREAGAVMLVTADDIFGTIGGGQMEYLTIDEARRLIAKGDDHAMLDLPLGPAIGQCCGGHVTIALTRADHAALRDLERAEERTRATAPHVYLFGGGHVGRALAATVAPLPVALHVVETRAAELEGLPAEAERHLTALPEAVAKDAPTGSAFVVLTHDHALDFLITAAALRRGDAAYVGLIGSATKRATFAGWLKREGDTPALMEKLVCPIGGSAVRDKRPEVIAALVAAELVQTLLGGDRVQQVATGEGENRAGHTAT